MWIKRVLKGTLLTVVIGGIGLAGWQGYQYWNAEQMDASLNEPETIVWQGNRPMPPTVDPGAYLTAMHASFRDDLQTAADSYLKVYNGDPKSPQAQREAYFFNALLGRFDQLKPVVREISEEYRFALFTDYVQAAYALKQENWAAARQVLEDAKDLPLGEVMKPLLLAWTYVGENDYSAAMKALEPLKQNPELSPYYDYHRGLMALAMKQEFAADDAFQALAEKDLPIFSLYPEVIAFYISRGQWTVANPFYVQWKAFVAQQPATGELITATTSKPLTAKRGVAEVFYNMSTAMGSSQSSYEGALVLSALSLYLNTKQDLPKIWSAEILEQVKKPHLAAYYYNQLNYAETQTIAFKKAMNLMACGRESEAKPILIRLKSTNKNSVQLWWALADVSKRKELAGGCSMLYAYFGY